MSSTIFVRCCLNGNSRNMAIQSDKIEVKPWINTFWVPQHFHKDSHAIFHVHPHSSPQPFVRIPFNLNLNAVCVIALQKVCFPSIRRSKIHLKFISSVSSAFLSKPILRIYITAFASHSPEVFPLVHNGGIEIKFRRKGMTTSVRRAWASQSPFTLSLCARNAGEYFIEPHSTRCERIMRLPLK